MPEKNNTIDDIINMLDNFSANNGGHMDITVNTENLSEKNVKEANSLECCSSNMACQVPTLFKGVEDLRDS